MLGSTYIVDVKTDGLTENRTPISHLAKAGATKIKPGHIIYFLCFSISVFSNY